MALVSRATFERVTGPKTDFWLVRMVGLLAVVIGATILLATREARVERPIRILAVGTALAFAMVDLRYAIPGRISRVYLADAAFEIALALALSLSWLANP